jgi:putative ATP-binding cassette transporter
MDSEIKQMCQQKITTVMLARHNHYRISLVAGQTDNPDQRIAEDVYRFINGGSDGSITAYGLYDFSILLISTVTSLVSFSIVLWSLSRSFTLPGTDLPVPGFLFWVALIYAASGTLATHLIGRPLIRLYFNANTWRPTSASRSPACANIPSRSRF